VASVCSFESSWPLRSWSAVWLGVGAWGSSSSEMLLSLSVFVSSKEQAVATRGRLHDELVKSEASATGANDSGSGSFSELESSHSQFRHFIAPLVIGNSGYCNNCSVPILKKHDDQHRLFVVKGTYCFFPRCLIILVSESGGLLTLDETSLRRTVLQNLESVLLDKNLKS
jgi:hypothetical protein